MFIIWTIHFDAGYPKLIFWEIEQWIKCGILIDISRPVKGILKKRGGRYLTLPKGRGHTWYLIVMGYDLKLKCGMKSKEYLLKKVSFVT
jgi:hypothetical protein